MQPVTELLRRSREGDSEAVGQLAPLVYDHLHRIAEGCLSTERRGHTLTATALIHEAWIKLIGAEQADFQDRNHFFALAARKMRQILVDYARQRGAAKRSSGKQTPLDDVIQTQAATATDAETVLIINDLLNKLEESNARRARFFELRYFGGLNAEEIAQIDGLSVATVFRELRLAQAWLYQQMQAR